MINNGMKINLRQILILGITGLLLWSACGWEVSAEGNIKGGFTKVNGEYLIESGEQLELLSKMVANREEIEPGVDAATASYRLRNDVVVRDRLQIGSSRSPFYGNFTGDGYKIIGKDFFIWPKYRYDETGKQIRIEEYIRYNLAPEKPIAFSVKDVRSLKVTQYGLTSVPKESLGITVAAEGLYMQDITRLVKLCWDVNHYRNHYSVSIFDCNYIEDSHYRYVEESDALLPFLDLFGEEAGAIMRQTAEEEDSYVSFLRLERIGGLDICTFAIRASEEEKFHVMMTGEWENTEIESQHLVIPTTGILGFSQTYAHCDFSQVDINFDGKEDLLIYEGASGGSGGSWGDYRAVVWDDDAEEFVWYPSFPMQLVRLEFNEKRMISHYRVGYAHEVVCEYGVVDGEYVETRRVSWDCKSDGSSTLSYYEMEVLVEQHDVTDLDTDEVAAYYPDLNLWTYG